MLDKIIPKLLVMVDGRKKIAVNPAYELSFLKLEEQQCIVIMDEEQTTSSLS